MYMVTMAARISRRVLSREARNASAAPWNRVWMLAGRPISLCACSIAATAEPSDAFGPRLNESVTAGNWPAWLMTGGVWRSSTVAMLASCTCLVLLPPVAFVPLLAVALSLLFEPAPLGPLRLAALVVVLLPAAT